MSQQYKMSWRHNTSYHLQVRFILLFILLFSPQFSAADDNWNDETSDAVAVQTAAAATEIALAPPRSGDRKEFSLLPMIAYDSDLGFQFGAVGILANFKPGYSPYRWRASLTLIMSAKHDNGKTTLPCHDYDLRFDIPDLWGGKLRLYPMIVFSLKNDVTYYGLGNSTSSTTIQQMLSEDSRYYQYTLLAPRMVLNARLKIVNNFYLMNGIQVHYARPKPGTHGKLAADIESARHKELELFGTEPRAWLQLGSGIVVDTRDHETTPTRGMWHELSVRFVPSGVFRNRDRFGGAHLNTRFYFPLLGQYLVLASRFITDILWGNVPFYEQGMAGTFVSIGLPGGGEGVRGIPYGRYHGKVKMAANIELRSMVYQFTLFRQHFLLGGAIFFDAGRIWGDFHSELDATVKGLGLKYGTGGGLRLRWGETVLIRFDVAYSKDALQIFGTPGFYVQIGEIF